jgi:hypothetical protein
MSDYNKKEKLKIEELKNLLALLDKAEKSFDYSINKCHSIGIKEDYSFEELDAFEALTARFARISDILIQKILSLIFIILKETPLTTIDKINMAEKYGIIKSADGLLAARELRNEISHEYKSADILTLFHETLKMSNILSLEIANIKNYISAKIGV